MNEYTHIVRGNKIVVRRRNDRKARFVLGPKSIITQNHFFDLVESIKIGENTVIGGIHSQFWTHSFDIDRNLHAGDIVIGANCFIGSAVRFSPGSLIGNNCIVGIGSVIVGKFEQSNVLIAGCPARIIRELN